MLARWLRSAAVRSLRYSVERRASPLLSRYLARLPIRLSTHGPDLPGASIAPGLPLKFSRGESATGSDAMLTGELQGLAIDFTTATGANAGLGQVSVKDTTTPANNRSNVAIDTWLTNSGTSPKLRPWSSGNLEWTAHNLFQQSQTFDNVFWTKSRASISANAIAAPDGTLTADKIVEDATATNTHRLFESSTTVLANADYAISFDLKAAERTWAFVRGEKNGATGGVYFNLSTGAVGTADAGFTGSTVSLGSGWWRCTVIENTGSSVGVNGYVGLATGDGGASYSGDGASGIYIWGAQLNRGSTPTAYLATTTAARFAVPLEYVSGYYGLAEPAATDLLLNTAALSTQNVTTSAVAYTLSFYGTGTVTLSGTSTDGPLVGTGASDRVSLTFTPSAGTLTLTVSGSVTNAQLETGSVATSVTPSFAATVTRATDALNAVLSTIPFSATVGTVYLKGKTPKAAAAAVLLSLDDGTANERIRITYTGTNINVVVTDGGVAQATIDLGAVAVDTAYQVTFGWELNSFAASLNGAAVVTDVSGTLPTVTTLRIGKSDEQGVSRFDKLVYAPRRVTNGNIPAWKYAA